MSETDTDEECPPLNQENQSSSSKVVKVPDNPDKQQWREQLKNMHIDFSVLDRLVMDYLVREGHKKVAEKFEEESGSRCLPVLGSIEKLEEKTQIRVFILEGNIKSAISLINDLYPELLDRNRLLLLKLQLQQLTELIRQGKILEAISYSQLNLQEIGEEHPDSLIEIERVMSLLVFADPENSPFRGLLQTTKRQEVWSNVNDVFKEMMYDTSCPDLTKIVQVLSWSHSQLKKNDVSHPPFNILQKCAF